MSRSPRGFTLIELMVVVAIVGILATLAVPGYELAVKHARRSELGINVESIRLTEHAYFHEWDTYTACTLAPAALPTRTQVTFPATSTTSLDWNQLGWLPDGKVYGQYQVTIQSGAVPDFTANAYSDLDGDGNIAHVQATATAKPALVTPNNIY